MGNKNSTIPARLLGDEYKVEWLVRHFETRDDFEDTVNDWQEDQTRAEMAITYSSRIATMGMTIISAVQSAGIKLDNNTLSYLQLALGVSVIVIDTVCNIIINMRSTSVDSAAKQFPPEFFEGKTIPWHGGVTEV